MISDRTRGKNAPVGKLAKPSDLESEDVVGSTPTIIACSDIVQW